MRRGWLLALAVSGCTNVIGAEFGDDYRVEPPGARVEENQETQAAQRGSVVLRLGED